MQPSFKFAPLQNRFPKKREAVLDSLLLSSLYSESIAMLMTESTMPTTVFRLTFS